MQKFTTGHLTMMLQGAAQGVPVGSVWQHKGGGRYVVVDHVFDTANQTIAVVYRPVLEHDVKFSRPYSEWSVDRFVRVD